MTEDNGEVIGMALAWPANFKLEFEKNNNQELRVLAGMNPYASHYKLKKAMYSKLLRSSTHTVQKETDRSVVISTVGHVNMVYATEKIHVIPDEQLGSHLLQL